MLGIYKNKNYDYSDYIKAIFDLITIPKIQKYITGSNSLNSVLYPVDYDLNQPVKKITIQNINRCRNNTFIRGYNIYPCKEKIV